MCVSRPFGGDSSGCARSGRQGPFLPGPGFRAAVASPTDGARSRDRVGPGAVARYRSHPQAGLRALGPRPGLTGAGPTASSPSVASALTQRGRADERRFRRGLLRGPGRAARRSGSALVPSGRRAAAANGVRRAHPVMPRVRAFLGNGCAAGRASARTQSRRGRLPRACRPRPACRARRCRCVSDGRDRLARVRPRTGPAGPPPLRPSLRPYAGPFTTVYPPAVPSRRRGRFRCISRRTGVGAAPTRGDRRGIRR